MIDNGSDRGGTSIRALTQGNQQQGNFRPDFQTPMQVGGNDYHNQSDGNNTPNYPVTRDDYPVTNRNSSRGYQDAPGVAARINKSLESDDDDVPYVPHKKHNRKKNKNKKTKDKKYFGVIPEMLMEPLIILILFVFLSLDCVKGFFGSYLSCMEHNASSLLGIIAYGIILCVLFVVIKKVII